MQTQMDQVREQMNNHVPRHNKDHVFKSGVSPAVHKALLHMYRASNLLIEVDHKLVKEMMAELGGKTLFSLSPKAVKRKHKRSK